MFKLNFVTPERKIVAGGEIEEITVPAHRGELSILPGHVPLFTTLEPGILKYRLKGTDRMEKYAVSWGYCQVSTDAVNVLAELAVASSEVDVTLVRQQLQAQENRLLTETLDEIQWQEAQKSIALLQAEIELSSMKA